MLMELETEMEKFGMDSESEKDSSPQHNFKPIGLGREKVPLKKEALHKAVKKPKNKNSVKQVRNKSTLRKCSNETSYQTKNISPSNVWPNF